MPCNYLTVCRTATTHYAPNMLDVSIKCSSNANKGIILTLVLHRVTLRYQQKVDLGNSSTSVSSSVCKRCVYTVHRNIRRHECLYILGPVSLTIFARNSNWMENSPQRNSVAGHPIATIFCTCHDSTAVVPCTKFCSDRCVRIVVTVKRNFHRIWITMEKPLVKRGPGITQGGDCSSVIKKWFLLNVATRSLFRTCLNLLELCSFAS